MIDRQLKTAVNPLTCLIMKCKKINNRKTKETPSTPNNKHTVFHSEEFLVLFEFLIFNRLEEKNLILKINPKLILNYLIWTSKLRIQHVQQVQEKYY